MYYADACVVRCRYKCFEIDEAAACTLDDRLFKSVSTSVIEHLTKLRDESVNVNSDYLHANDTEMI